MSTIEAASGAGNLEAFDTLSKNSPNGSANTHKLGDIISDQVLQDHPELRMFPTNAGLYWQGTELEGQDGSFWIAAEYDAIPYYDDKKT